MESPENVAELLRQAQAEQAKAAEQAKVQETERLADSSLAFGQKVKSGIQIFSDQFNLLLHRDALVLVGAASGRGKSTFCTQTAAHAVSKGRRVLILSNEMSRYAYYVSAGTMYSRLATNLLPRDAILKCVQEKLLVIEDIDTSAGKTAAFDALPGYTMEKIAALNPDLVLIDQISCAKNSTSQNRLVRVDEYAKLTQISRELGRAINQNRGLPPIVMFQQSLDSKAKDKKPGGIDMQSNLRGAKDTFNDATHCIYIERNDENVTTISVQKQRYASPHMRKSDWVMNAHGLLVPFSEALKAQASPNG